MWSLDEKRMLTGPAGSVRLSKKQVTLLQFLGAYEDADVPLRDIRRRFGYASDKDIRTDISRLRLRMSGAGLGGCVRTVHGFGYKVRMDIAITATFSTGQWKALRAAVSIAERQIPGISERIGL
jgi:DNA-binding winged helix-turn-helix (wHTH) protein